MTGDNFKRSADHPRASTPDAFRFVPVTINDDTPRMTAISELGISLGQLAYICRIYDTMTDYGQSLRENIHPRRTDVNRLFHYHRKWSNERGQVRVHRAEPRRVRQMERNHTARVRQDGRGYEQGGISRYRNSQDGP